MSGFNTFSSLSPEDLWAITGISFAAPVRDIMEKEGFTLEDLLMESELIQEVKSGNKQLLDFLTKEETMSRIIKYLSVPSKPDIDMDVFPTDNETFKFPYICSEIISCEVYQILSCIVEVNDGMHTKNYLKMLEVPSGSLDPLLSGYMEKIFETLLRHFSTPMFELLNADNCNLSLSFLKHINNFSIVQILQRLLLPHIPYSPQHDDSDRHGSPICQWAHSRDFCIALVETFLRSSGTDSTLHLNELLITVIQLSPVDAQFIENLSSPDLIAPMCTAIRITAEAFSEAGPAIEEDASSGLGIDVAVAMVIDCLVSKFNDSIPVLEDDVGSPSSPSSPTSSPDTFRPKKDHLLDKINGICLQLVDVFPSIVDIVNRCGHNDSKYAQPKLGTRRLAYVKLVQALLSLSNSVIDDQIYSSHVIPTIVNLMFTFPRHSVLHFSIQRIILLLIEDFDREGRRALFTALMGESGLVNQIMEYVKDKHPSARQTHHPLLGHLYDIGKVLVYGLNSAASKSRSEDYDPTSSEAYVRKFRESVSSLVDLTSWDSFVDTSFRDLIRRNSTTSSSLDNSMMSDKTADFETPLGSKDDDYNSNSNDWGDSHNPYKNNNGSNNHGDHDDDDDDDDDDDEEDGEDEHEHRQRGGYAPSDTGVFDAREDLFANFEDSKASFESSSAPSSAFIATESVFDPFKSSTAFPDSDTGDNSSSNNNNSNSSNNNSSDSNNNSSNSMAEVDPFSSSSSSNDDPFGSN